MAKLFRYKQINTLRNKWKGVFLKAKKNKINPTKKMQIYYLCMNACDYCRLVDHYIWDNNTKECKQTRRKLKEILRNRYKESLKAREEEKQWLTE